MIKQAAVIVFYLTAATMVIAAWRVVATRNLIHSVLAAFVVLLSTAGLYFLLNAKFLSMVQALVYAGAVTILMLFVVMLTRPGHTNEVVGARQFNRLAMIFAFLFGGLLWLVIINVQWVIGPPFLAVDTTRILSKEIFLQYILPFEVASIVLLVAIIGAVILAGKE